MAARDILLGGVILFILAISFFAIKFGSDSILDKFTSNPVVNQSQTAVTAINNVKANGTAQMDNIFLAFFIAFVIGIIVSGWFIAGNPVFMTAYIIIWIVSVVVSSVLVYVWDIFTNLSVFGTTLSSFPIMAHIIGNLPLYIAIIGFIGVIVMFAKPTPEGGYQ